MRAPAAFLSLAVLALAGTTAGPLRFSVDAAGEKEAKATISGPEADLAPGPFQGSISVNGSPAQLPISGTVTHAGGRWVMPVTVKYADIPAAWADSARLDTFTYLLKGSGPGGAAREWTGTQAWKEVQVGGGNSDEFLKLQDVRLTEMTLTSSEAVGELAILNPLSFDLRIAEAEYVLFADGVQVGDGSARGLILHGGQRSVLNLPIEIDHASLLSAAGRALLSGGDVAVRLTGKLVVRLKGGDLAVPLDLSGHLSNAS